MDVESYGSALMGGIAAERGNQWDVASGVLGWKGTGIDYILERASPALPSPTRTLRVPPLRAEAATRGCMTEKNRIVNVFRW